MQERLFTCRTFGEFVQDEHPLRPMREILNTALKNMDELFARGIRTADAPSG